MSKLVLWIDDLRNPPNRPGEQYVIARSVNEAKYYIELGEFDFAYIDLDHDAGIYAPDGGDYINILNYIEEKVYHGYKVNYAFHIHSFNPVGVVNMRAIIKRNGWKELL